VLEITIIETDGAKVNGIATTKAGKQEINRLIAEGNAKLVASLQVRTRTGENFSAKVGQRIPIQTATMRRTDEGNSRDQLQSQGVSIPLSRIEYENTGLLVEGTAQAVGDGLLDIKIKIELTGVDQGTGRLTPTFTQRTFTDVVKMTENETAMLMGFVQPTGGRSLTLDQIASGASKPATGAIVVLLTTKPVQ
jgi:type II secretory pathway component GspD/PulD (secretin)